MKRRARRSKGRDTYMMRDDDDGGKILCDLLCLSPHEDYVDESNRSWILSWWLFIFGGFIHYGIVSYNFKYQVYQWTWFLRGFWPCDPGKVLDQGRRCLRWLIVGRSHPLKSHVDDIIITNTLTQLSVKNFGTLLRTFGWSFTNRMWLCSVGPLLEPCNAPLRSISSGRCNCSCILAFSHPWPRTRGQRRISSRNMTLMAFRADSLACLLPRFQ